MSSVVDFLEKMGSEARWRNASPDDIELALADANIDASMSAAILAQSTSAVQALLGKAELMGMLIPGPTPDGDEPEREEEDEEEEEGEHPGLRKQSKADCAPASMSSTASLL
jgi:hypothetical protein